MTVKCYWCGYVSELGEVFYVWDDKSFCSEECVDEYVLSDVDPLENMLERMIDFE